MDCTICGKATMPGAMLCAPCKAALKRARYVTIQEDMRRPSVIDARRMQRRPRPATPPPEPAASVPPPADRMADPMADPMASPHLARRIFAGILLLATVLGAASYFGLRELGARAHDESLASAPAAVLATEVRPAPSKLAEALAVTVPAPAAAPVAAAPDGIDAGPQPPASKPSPGAASKRATLPANASFATANGDPPDAVAPPPEPEKIAAAPPPPQPVPDRWQNMRDALAQCDKEGLIGGLICGQRVRMQYCDGYWGKAAQCPSAASAYER